MKNMKVNILGTEYSIETHKVSEDEYMQKNRLAGYCGEEDKKNHNCRHVRGRIFHRDGRKIAKEILEKSL